MSIGTLRDQLAGTGASRAVVVVDDHRVGVQAAAEIEPVADVCILADREDGPGQVADDVLTVAGDATDIDVLRAAGADDADIGVVAAETDQRTLLVCQLLRARYDVETLVALVSDPDCASAFEDTGATTVCASAVLATEIRSAVESTVPSHRS